MADVKVKGLADLNKFLQQLPAKVEQSVLRGALRAGANVVMAEAKANDWFPVDSGRSTPGRIGSAKRGYSRTASAPAAVSP